MFASAARDIQWITRARAAWKRGFDRSSEGRPPGLKYHARETRKPRCVADVCTGSSRRRPSGWGRSPVISTALKVLALSDLADVGTKRAGPASRLLWLKFCVLHEWGHPRTPAGGHAGGRWGGCSAHPRGVVLINDRVVPWGYARARTPTYTALKPVIMAYFHSTFDLAMTRVRPLSAALLSLLLCS